MGCAGIGNIKIYIWMKERKESKNIDTPTPNIIFRANNSTTIRSLKFYIFEKASIQIEDQIIEVVP